MNKPSLIALLVSSALFSTAAMAQQISGKVLDSQGQPIINATVKIIGQNNQVTTNQSGVFIVNIDDKGGELHIFAPSFVHKNVMVSAANNGDLEVKLEKAAIEIIDVVASPFHNSNIESAMPATVLSGDNLRMSQTSTLGDTLKNEIGVHSNFHGGVASTPIIRGLDGPRVLIAQNGLDAGDASRVGPDHSVSAEATTSERIEVLRGPATLFYGSGAIGGVVNVVDDRVPTSLETKGEWLIQQDSVNDKTQVAGSVNHSVENIVLHLDGFWRDADNYEVPSEHGIDEIDSSQHESSGYTIGTSYLLDQGYVGVSYQELSQKYGIPGHSHGDEEVPVIADMSQNRLQLLSEYQFNHYFFNSMRNKVAFTDYQHQELELGHVGTTFDNETLEARIELLHNPLAQWRGGLSLHYKESDFAAIGLEAFTPASITRSSALALVEERHFGNVLVQLGARAEHTEINADLVQLPNVTLYDRQGHEQHNELHYDMRHFNVSHTFKPVSFSGGLVWDFTPGYNFAVSVSRAQRAPSSSELLSFGPHIGTNTYEVGALFKNYLNSDDEAYIGLTDQDIVMETSNNLDLSIRKYQGDFGFIFNVFYNQIDDYYYQQAIGLSASDGHDHHDHGHDEHGHDEHDDHGHGNHSDHVGHTLPLYMFVTTDAKLYGAEFQVNWRINDNFNAKLQGDTIRARANGNSELPRTPPTRLAGELSYEHTHYRADLKLSHYFEQTNLAQFETKTDSYSILDIHFNYFVDIANHSVALYLKGENLTDEYAKVHTSFLKDLTPLPGRNFAVGIRGQF